MADGRIIMNTNTLEVLSASFLFQRLAPTDLERLVRYSRLRQIEPREVIFHKGDPSSQMFVILSGHLKISTLSEEGREITFGILGPGEMLGEISVLDGKERTASATAVVPSEVLVIERKDLVSFLEDYPRLAFNLLSALAARLRATDEFIEDIMFRNLTSRLAKKLSTLAEEHGESAEAGVRIKLKLSQQDIGNLIGTSRESVNKQLRAWESEGLVELKQGFITLLKPEKLEKLAEFYI